MLIVANKFFLGKKFTGMVLWPFLIVRHKNLCHDAVFMNHERIHWRQQVELLVLPFYVWYFIEYLVRLLQYKNSAKAYYAISFEKEAYQNETNMEYTKNRRFWSFIRYLI